MSLMVNDEAVAARLIAERRAQGLDQHDEVWDGIYMMSPLADNEHQELATELAAILRTVVDWQGLGKSLVGANVSDRRDDWTTNYRVPDVLVFGRDTSAVDCGTHWLGGPDLAIEIVSRGDRTLEKLDFYARVGTRELLVIDRRPWRVTQYRLDDSGRLTPVAVSSEAQATTIHLEFAPLGLSVDAVNRCLRVADRDGAPLREISIQ
jgi:Uma2 family endonuclease